MAHLDPTFRKLDGPIRDEFDCGEEAQNRFLLDQAWSDQQEQYTVTHLAYVGGMLAGYVSLLMDSLELTREERPASASFATIPALKVAQMGVDKRFQRQGLGEQLLGVAMLHAQERSRTVGCRYVILDALPHRVEYYEKRGFTVNESVHNKNLKRAEKGKRDPAAVSVSMRFDLREPGELAVDYHSALALASPSSFTTRFAREVGFAFESLKIWLERNRT